MGTIRSVKEPHLEEPKRVLWLGAIRYFNGEESFKRADEGKKVATWSHNLSPRVHPDPSHMSVHTRPRRKSKGPSIGSSRELSSNNSSGHESIPEGENLEQRKTS